MNVVQLAQTLMKVERIGWSKAIYEAQQRLDAQAAQAERERVAARERRTRRKAAYDEQQ